MCIFSLPFHSKCTEVVRANRGRGGQAEPGVVSMWCSHAGLFQWKRVRCGVVSSFLSTSWKSAIAPCPTGWQCGPMNRTLAWESGDLASGLGFASDLQGDRGQPVALPVAARQAKISPPS